MIVVRITAAQMGLDGTRDGFAVLVTGREKQVVSDAAGRSLMKELKALWQANSAVMFDGFSFRMPVEVFDGTGI